MTRERERPFLSGYLARWPHLDYGFLETILEGHRITVFVHARSVCEHLDELRQDSARMKNLPVYFYLHQVERGWSTTRAICKECYERTMQRRRQRAALMEARQLLNNRRFDLGPGYPSQFFRKELISQYPVLYAAERAAAGKLLACASHEEALAAASDEMRRVLDTTRRT